MPLFIVSKISKQSQCPAQNEWGNKIVGEFDNGILYSLSKMDTKYPLGLGRF